MTGTAVTRLGAVLLAVVLAAEAMAAPARTTRKKTTGKTNKTVMSGAQVLAKFESIEEQLKKLNLTLSGGQLPTTPVAVAPVSDKALTEAFYNYGVYSKQAAGSRTASRAIKLVTLVAGGALVVHGWTDSFDKSAPRTINNAFHDYPAFSYGLSTVLVGQLIGVILDMRADGADARAARALMKPLEAQSSPAAAPSTPAASMIAPASAAP